TNRCCRRDRCMSRSPISAFSGWIAGPTSACPISSATCVVRQNHRPPSLGKLLVAVPGKHGNRSCSDGLYDMFDDACKDLVAAGVLDRSRYERFLFPVYFRSVDEMLAPLN